MDLLAKLNLLSIPRWVKTAIIVLLCFLGLVNTYLFFDAMWLSKSADLAAASVQLLSVVLPIFILALLVAQADTGTRALTLRTAQVLHTVLPEALARITESPSSFFKPSRKGTVNPRLDAADVEINLVEGECHCDYRIEARAASARLYRMLVRVELNVRKVNLNVYVPRSAADNPAKPSDIEEISRRLANRFRHTIEGATMASAEHAQDHAVSRGYAFNTVCIERRVDGRDYICLVARKDLSPDFLWNSSEQLYFANDLKLMLRSFLHEAPEYFSEPTASSGQ